jgi:hypothetical protein
MNLAVPPGHDFAVEPERAVAFVEWDQISHEVLENSKYAPPRNPLRYGIVAATPRGASY